MQDHAPIVGRPRGNAWRVLQADGIEWEGQIYLIGEQIDLAMRLIVTRRRVAFARGGGVALEIDRAWLAPAPVISRLGDVTLFVDAEGTGKPDKLRLQFRDGRVSADQLVRHLGGGPERPMPRRTPPIWESWSSSNFAWLDGTDQPPSPAPEPALFPPATGWEAFDRGLPAGPTILDSGDFPPIAETSPDGPPINGRSSSRSYEPVAPAEILNDAERETSAGDAPWLVAVDGLTIKPEHRTRRSVAIRLGGLIILLAAAALFGANRWPDAPINFGNRDEATIAAPSDVAGGIGDPGLPDVSPDEEAIDLGVGGPDGEIVTGDTPTPDPTATDVPPEPTATDVPPDPTATERPPDPTATEIPPEPTATPTEPPVEEATEAPPEPTAEETPPPTEEPVSEPTIAPAGDSTETPVEVVTPPQGPTVGSGEVPDQVVATGAFRYTVESVQRAGEIQGLGLPDVGGDWVVAIVNVLNWSDRPAAFEMASITLQTSGPSAQQVPLDSGTEFVAQTLGLVPAYGANSSALFAGSESHRVALVFLVTPDTEGVALQVGDQRVDLQRALQEAVDPATLGDGPELGRIFEGEVVAVLDGETFTVDIEGVVYTVRINGIDAPVGDACFATEAAERTTTLLTGQRVRIERQRTNLDENGHLLRDVWIVTEPSAPLLAAAVLAGDGAAIAAPEGQNTRYAGWIAESESAARAADAGLWGACDE